MARVLISFLGTGKMKDGDNAKGEYESANYKINDEDYSAKFIAEALIKAYGIEKIILIGTVKSMWDEVYATFAGDDLDADIWEKLQKIRQSVSHESELVLKGKDKEVGVEIEVPKEVIENVLPGNDSKIVFIKYGLNDTEFDENITKILGIEEYLNDNDEIYFDITHGFRSLPMVLMNCIIYLQNVSNKKITIEKITYGNLDVSGEMDYAPVINLSKLLNLSEWINGAYAFKEFGKGYKIAELLEDNKSAGNIIKEFSDVMSADYLTGIRSQVQKLSGIKNAKYNPIAQALIPQVIEEYVKRFPSNNISDSRFQYEIAKWHFEHMNYSSAVMDILEALLSKVKEICGTSDSEYAKIYLGKKNYGKNSFSDSQTNIDKLERYLNHLQGQYNTKEIVSFLDNKHKWLKGQRDKTQKQEHKDEINKILPQIKTEGKNAFSLIYSINVFRNSIAHQTGLSLFNVDDTIRITKLCIELMGKII